MPRAESRLPLPQRIRRLSRVTDNGCWEWLGYRDPDGYGVIYFTVGPRRTHPHRAHRISYEVFVGEIPDGLVIDHLCRNRGCVNPDHLEPVTDEENRNRGIASATKTHCVNDHEFTEANTRWSVGKNGRLTRTCRACVRANVAAYKRRRAAASEREAGKS